MTDYTPRLVPYSSGAGARAAIAKRLLEAGRLELALKFLDRALGENPELAEAHLLKGSALAAIRRGDEALRHLRLAIRLDPQSAAAWSELAWIEFNRGNFGDAETTVDRALSLGHDRDPEARARDHLVLARVHRALERNDDAVAAYRKTVEHAPSSVEAHVELGELLLLVGDDAAALRHLEIAKQLQPRHARARMLLADAALRRGDASEALSEYKAATELAPSDMAAYLKLAELYRDQGRNNMALLSLRMASVFSPRDAACWEAIARIYLEECRYEDATEFAERALRLDPERVGAREVKRLVAQAQDAEPSSGT